MTRDELAALPTVLDVPTAAKVLGIGRSLAYDLVRRDDWPTPVLHVGKLIKIPSAPLLALLSEQPEVTLHADFGERLRA
jgi:predicted DNA-binding transcriptional regulator AlpA